MDCCLFVAMAEVGSKPNAVLLDTAAATQPSQRAIAHKGSKVPESGANRALSLRSVVMEEYRPAAGFFWAQQRRNEDMHSVHVRQIREGVAAAQRFAQKSTLDGCDLSDIDEITVPLAQELERPHPNPQTLATYLNSLLRSLRAQPHAEEICAQLDEAMKASGIATDWQHG
jgi:hypothetical protein